MDEDTGRCPFRRRVAVNEQVLRFIKQQQRVSRCHEALRQPETGKPLVACRFSPVLIRLDHRPQICADLRGKRCREGGLTGTRRPIEQDVDADLMPDKGSTQNRSGHFGLSAEMCKCIPGQRLGGYFSEQLIIQVGLR